MNHILFHSVFARVLSEFKDIFEEILIVSRNVLWITNRIQTCIPLFVFLYNSEFYFPSLYCGITFTTQSLVLMASLVFWCTQVRVQSDPAGRLVITGQPEQLDNPWGITPFKKVCL